MRSSKKKRQQANDAAFCRFKGWEPGTVLTLLEDNYRITAVGEEAILVRRVSRSKEHAELKWVSTLVKSEVVSAKPLEFALRQRK